MKKYIYPMAITAALFATACSDDVVNDVDQPVPDSQKEMISFSLSDGAGTRAGFTGGTTRIIARIQSNEKDGSGCLFTKTVLSAAKDNTTDATALQSSFSTVTYATDANTKYWDDAFGRNAQLSVYAVAIPNSTDDTKLKESLVSGEATKWAAEATPNNNMNWSVSTDQSESSTLTTEDLVYSNNIQANGTNGRYVWSYSSPEGYPAENGRSDGHSDGCLVFTQKPGAPTSDPGHFDKGHLVFKHALSRIDVTLVSGDGFNDTDDNATEHDFVLSSDGITFTNMNVGAPLDIAAGTWGSKTTGNVVIKPTISSKSVSGASKAVYNGTIQVIPDYVFGATSTTNVMTFTIDGNTYYVDHRMVYDALKNVDGVTITNNTIKLEQQTRYFLTITVNKTKIDNLTATLQPWIDVTAENTPLENSYVTLNVSSATGGCDDVALYRLADGDGNIYTNVGDNLADNQTFYNWKNPYEGPATLTKKTQVTNDGKFSTNWYFEDNKTFYHFRTVNTNTTLESDKKTFKIVSGAQENHDYHWGAPMIESPSLAYNVTADTDDSHTEGYSLSIYKAIGSTKGEIKITELHMMSNINVVLKTTDGGDKVDLTGAKVYLTNFISEGLVNMGSGFITPDISKIANTDVAMSDPTEQKAYFRYAVVPQELKRGTSSSYSYIKITIETGDHNKYYIDENLSKVYATAVNASNPNNQATASSTSTDTDKESAAITRWYPGYSYTYTFTLTKKGIEAITCSLVDWIDVTGSNTDLNLEGVIPPATTGSSSN